jgi:enoyl-CoA hydratase/carnithine racemase
MSETVRSEAAGGVLRLVIDRPHKLNALDWLTIDRLGALLDERRPTRRSG